MNNLNIPIYRAKKIDSDEYVIGSLIHDRDNCYIVNILFLPALSLPTEKFTQVDPTTLAIKMPERDFFISLDVENGKGGDKIAENKVLIWNGEMMNCSVILFDKTWRREDYLIDFDNFDYDKMEVIGIQK